MKDTLIYNKYLLSDRWDNKDYLWSIDSKDDLPSGKEE